MRLKSLFEFSQHRFVKSVATLQVGSFAGTVFQAGVGVLIARILQPELFGVYSLVFGLAGLGGLLLGAGTQEAVATILGSAYAKQDRQEVSEALSFLLKITLYAGAVTLVLVFFLPYAASYFYGNPLIGWYASLVILGVFLSSSITAVVQLSLQVVGRIKILTLIVFGDQFLRFGSALILVFLGFGVLGAVGGQLIGAIITFLASVLVWENIKNNHPLFPPLRKLLGQVSKIPIKKYFGFSFWVAVDRNMGNLFMVLPVVLTGIYVSAGEVSFFKLAFGFINLALSLLGPISTLLNVEFTRMQVEDPKKLYYNLVKVSLYGVLFSSVLTVGMIALSPIAFKLLYGASFVPGVKYVFGLLFYGALFGVGIGLGPMWRALNAVKTSIIINLFVLGFGIPSGLYMIRSWGLWGAVAMVTLWFTVSHLISFFYLARRLGRLPKS